MTLDEREGWLFVKLTREERASDLDWGRFVRWKIPEGERVCVPDLDTWIVRAEHRSLIEHLFAIYKETSEAGVDLAKLRSVQKKIEALDAAHPGPDSSNQEHFRAWLKDIGLN